MKHGHYFLMLSVIVVAPQLPMWNAILTGIWFFCCGIYYLGKEQ